MRINNDCKRFIRTVRYFKVTRPVPFETITVLDYLIRKAKAEMKKKIHDYNMDQNKRFGLGR